MSDEKYHTWNLSETLPKWSPVMKTIRDLFSFDGDDVHHINLSLKELKAVWRPGKFQDGLKDILVKELEKVRSGVDSHYPNAQALAGRILQIINPEPAVNEQDMRAARNRILKKHRASWSACRN